MTDAHKQKFSDADLDDLKKAKTKLEYPSLTAKIAHVIGGPFEAGFDLLPKNWTDKVSEYTQAALLEGLEFSIYTMGKPETKRSQDWLHKLLVVGSGVAGGAAGLVSFAVELPFTTCVILRSIADIARSEGHDIASLEVRLGCLEVLALGGQGSQVKSVKSGYWTIRGLLAKSVSDAASYLEKKGLTETGAPPLVRLVTTIAARFNIVITEGAAAKAVPVVGALSGGAINYVFMNHFQEMARGHFVIKRHEKKYGMKHVEKTYEDLVI